MSPKFSVITPSHNEGEWLQKTVLGVLENTDYPDFEIIVVADGCTDGSTDFLKQGMPNVKCIELPESRGSIQARNIGAKEAEGEYLVFIDSHMIPTDEHWLKELALQLEDPKIGAASLKIPHLEDPKRTSYIYTLKDLELEPTWVPPTSKTETELVPAIAGGCFGIRKSVFEETGGFDNGLHKWGREDFEYSLRLWRLGYDLSFSPKAGIGHSWERKRTFRISWKEVDYNILRTAFTLLSDTWAEKVTDHLTHKRPKNVPHIVTSLLKDEGFLGRKQKLAEKFTRSFEEYLREFKDKLPILKKCG